MNCFDPIALSVGSFTIYWYALFFLLAWVGVSSAFYYFEKQKSSSERIKTEEIEGLFWGLLLCGFVGARLGYVFFYDPSYFAGHPLEIFIPYNFTTHTWTTLRGMSYHGGFLGVALGGFYYARKYKISWQSLGDRLALVAPIGSFFGRLGNFLNQELPGKVTEMGWGMYFPGESVLRHPVTLYSAFLEGIFLFGWMLLWRRIIKREGDLMLWYIFSYGVVRMIVEIWREPDPGVSLLLDVFSRGQLLSLAMIFVAFFGWFFRAKHVSIEST